ncbi:hypothetical protein GZL_08939 [Streptomyces sp. 769]|nr:hypothetical protein GZL_08939 [Streptomyces sp. 769]
MLRCPCRRQTGRGRSPGPRRMRPSGVRAASGQPIGPAGGPAWPGSASPCRRSESRRWCVPRACAQSSRPQWCGADAARPGPLRCARCGRRRGTLPHRRSPIAPESPLPANCTASSGWLGNRTRCGAAARGPAGCRVRTGSATGAPSASPAAGALTPGGGAIPSLTVRSLR